MKRIAWYNKLLKKRLLLGLLIIGIGLLMPATAQAAFLDNEDNIPDNPVKNDMYRTFAQGGWNQVRGGAATNNQCGYGTPKYNHAQWTWISIPNANGVNNNDKQDVTIGANDTSVALQMNATAAICDSIININGQITDTSLQETQTNLFDVKARLRNTGQISTAISGFVPQINQNYGFNYNDGAGNQRRFVKYSGSLPYFDEFNLAGLQNFDLQLGVNYIDILADSRAVNRYSSGAQYRCVTNGGGTVGGFNSASCPLVPDEIQATIRLVVEPAYDGQCDVTKINGAPVNGPVYLNPGESFTASFVVKNTGHNAWFTNDNPGSPEVESQVILGTDGPLDNTTWGAMRARITGDVFGGLVLASGGTSPEFTHTFSTPSNFSGDEGDFDWRLLKEPGPGIIPKIGATCGAELELRKNLPFVRVSGADSYAGAAFANNQYSCSNYPGLSTAQNAHIGTNGKWSYPTDEAQLSDKINGASTTQYAVFATGLIGNDLQSNTNNFLGNSAHVRHTTNGAQEVFEKDALFANQGNTPDQSYGKFDSTLPCFNISQLENLQPVVPGTLNSFVNSATTPSLVRVSSITPNLTTINPNRRVVILVDDPAGITISSNITYAASPNINQTPFLMIISKGPIYIQKGVSRIDAHLVAFPAYDSNGNLPAKSGTIDTCSDAIVGQEGVWPTGANKLTIGSCNSNQLVVNGTFVAKKVLWKRTRGSLNAPSTTTDSICSFLDGIIGEPSYQARLRACAAEHINFSPEAYFTNPLNNTGPGTATVGSSPLSTKELPPIF